MKKLFKCIFAVAIILATAMSMIPALSAQTVSNSETVLPAEAYWSADAVFAALDAMETAPAKKNATEEELTDSAAALVMANEHYVAGSLERNGNTFTWQTTEGIRCVYSPRMRDIQKKMKKPQNAEAAGVYNEPVATKGGWPSSNQVYLVAPYYGIDDVFTDQYKNEARDIATAIGDTDGYTLYSGKAATVDKVAEAVSKGAVVIFDSHGNTDYERGYDYVTGATSSYLCLSSTTGLTDADYDDGALYDSQGIWINGATIANHMKTNSPGGFLWMAICLGMATDTICMPLREKGVEVVYGYSQSVTFDGDYLWEEIFWDDMCAGATVSEAVADMKNRCGEWDYCTQMYNYAGWWADEYGPIATLREAREYYCAFPVVVSDEDSHPGQRKGNTFYGADSLQTVNSTYTLFSQYTVTAGVNSSNYGDVSVNGNVITAVPAEGYYAARAEVIEGVATVHKDGNVFTVSAESDCTIRIIFERKQWVHVYFSGAAVESQSGYSGEVMTLPVAEAPTGYQFIGWTGVPLYGLTAEKPVYYTDTFIPTAHCHLYALYSYVDENVGTGDYVKVTETPTNWSGEYVIVYEDAGYIFDGSLSKLDAVSNYQQVTIWNETIAAYEAEPYKFIVEEAQGGYTIRSAGGSYIGWDADANGLSASNAAMINTISLSASGDANIVGAAGAHLRFNDTIGQYRFRYYKAATYANQKPVALYVKDGSAGTTYYTSTVVTCDHTNGFTQNVTPATCKIEGMIVYTCVDCTYSYTEQIPVETHRYGAWITEEDGSSRTCTVCGDVQQGVRIIKQPKTAYATNDHMVKTTVTAVGEGLKYEWYIKNAGSSSYSKSAAKTATYSCKMSSSSKDRFVRCKITDKYGNSVWTKTVRLRMKASITTQPVSITVVAGKNAKFTVQAVGSGLRYQWQYRKTSTGSWSNTSAAGNDTTAMTIPATTARHGYQYRCRIKDSAGNTVYTKIVHLNVLGITKQPTHKTVKAGTTAKLTASVTGSNVTYQWQYRTSSSGSWKSVSANSGKTAAYSFKAEARHHGYQYRCRIKDSAGNTVYTKTVNLYVLGIKTQPVSKTVVAGKTAKFAVSATGKGLSYQWQYRTSSTGSWKNVSATSGKTAAYSLKTEARHHGYQYRCRIKDSAGNTIYSDIVRLYVLGIKTQPASKTVKVGATAKFTVSAVGRGLTYQWQYRTSSKTSWKNVSAASGKKAAYSLTAASRHNGYQYRCKITDSTGNVIYTNVVKLTVKK